MFDCGADHDTAPGRRSDVDIVDANACAPDDDEVLCRGEHGLGDLGRRSDDQRVRAGHCGEQVLGRKTQPHVDLVAGLSQTPEAALSNLFGDEYPCHTSSSRMPASTPVENSAGAIP